MKIQNGKKAGRLRCVMTCLLSIIVLASLISVSGCTKEAKPAPEIPQHYTTFTDEAGLFSISYPPDWEPDLFTLETSETAVKNTITALESDTQLELESDLDHMIFWAGIPEKKDLYSPSVNIGVDSTPGVEWTHNKLVEARITTDKELYPDYYLFSRVKTTVDGREATIIDSEGTFAQFDKLHVLKMIVLVGKTVWTVTCIPPLGEYSKWEEDFQAIVRSLRILK